MELEEVLLTRRSIRKFKNELVSAELIEKLLYFAMCAPSACNRRPWEFYVIQNEEILAKVKKTTLFSNKNAPLAIVVAGNIHKALPLHLKDYWIEDCSSAITHILLEATNLGLGSLWCGVYPEDRAVKRLRKTLNLEEHIVPLGIVLLGYPDESHEPRSQYDLKKVHYIK